MTHMSGVFGATAALTDGQVNQVQELLRHRGPDDTGVATFPIADRQVTFVHTRLAVQDPTLFGKQPMTSRDGKWCVNFNGELYKHYNLRARVGGEFRGSSDTESLVEYLAAFGIEETLAVLNGIFAFAALNRETGELFIARDPFGVKPLYYAQRGAEFFVSSEIKPLTALGCGGGMDGQALESFLSLRFVPSPRTLMAGISRLAPGHYMRVDVASGACDTRRYVQPTGQRFSGSLEDAVDLYQSALKESVRNQLASDRSVGILLSGGIDSAVIAALAAEYNRSVIGFTVGFGEQYPACEIADAAETAESLGIRYEEVVVTPGDLKNSLSEIVSCVEEPLGTTSIMPMWHLTRLARTQATVVFSGHGNDELWGGYRRYRIELLLDRYPQLKRPGFRLPGAFAGLPIDDGIRRGLACLGNPDTASRFRSAYSLFPVSDIQHLTGRTSTGGVEASIAYWLDWLGTAGEMTDSERMMRIDTRMGLAEDSLLYTDKISMAAGLETRLPLLDRDVVRFIDSLPVAYRTSLAETKVVHRAMARDYLPANIVSRPKKGFLVPFGEWSRGMWRDFVAERLLENGLKLHDHVERRAVEALWKQHQRRFSDRSRQVFALMMLSGWCETFL